jgi:hypothetical protein
MNPKPKTQNTTKMNTSKASFRSIVVGLVILVTSAFATSVYREVAAPYGNTTQEGMVYGVPNGAYVEWAVGAGGYAGWAVVMLGSGMNVSQTAGPGQYYSDVTTSSGGDMYYYLHAYAAYPGYDYAYAMFYVGW